MERRPARISLRRLGGIPVALAAASWVTPSGSKNSSRRMRPGWVRGAGLLMGVSSMIVGYFHLFGVGSGPDETDAPLVVDADAVLAGAVASQRFEPVAGRKSQERELHRGVDQL